MGVRATHVCGCFMLHRLECATVVEPAQKESKKGTAPPPWLVGVRVILSCLVSLFFFLLTALWVCCEMHQHRRAGAWVSYLKPWLLIWTSSVCVRAGAPVTGETKAAATGQQ